MPIPQAPIVLKGLAEGRQRFLYGLDITPDERLRWSPDEARKSPLQIGANLVQFLNFIAGSLTGKEMPGWDVDSLPAPETREAATEAIDRAFTALRQAIEALEPPDLARKPPTPWAESLEEVLWLIGPTIYYHQGQLNYLQLCYGDRDPNMPPSPG